MNSSSPIEQLPPEARNSLKRLHGRAWGIATGMFLGLGLFLATIILVLRDGPNMGEHLSLLSVYLPGYSVSVGGSFIGSQCCPPSPLRYRVSALALSSV